MQPKFLQSLIDLYKDTAAERPSVLFFAGLILGLIIGAVGS
jgi:hypothetical protein